MTTGGFGFRTSEPWRRAARRPALAGRPDYKRGIGNYTKRLYVRPEWAGKRLFLRFEGANSIADLFVDGRHVGEHRGGYGAFVFEITTACSAAANTRSRCGSTTASSWT